ncbi:PilZ domain-containing protein [Crocosphaera sp. UHCC 0190]|uniref:PilZ domain-containing protein n=1 Tax=Crocosphaera sp. UHCC 0190 TaxID=3110246 RepID=UPI002B20A3C9|nr:PilZ domain-containing protein [Crocosphaera sp. UHCC 0190]MEA5511659.1 PilZ domain-containing protein [Crocosphaera sp. UHCC 0190]
MSELPIDHSSIHSNRRRSKRIYVNKGSSIQLVFNQEQINVPFGGVIIDDSFHGCGLIVKSEEKLCPEQSFLILMQGMEPIPAKIVWSQQLENNQFKLGVKYVTSKSLKTKIFFQKTRQSKAFMSQE